MRTLSHLLVMLLLLSGLAAAQGGTYTQIDYPNAISTFPSAINDSGDIVGSYHDQGHFQHGFLLRGGVFTPIDFGSKESDTVATGINDLGQVTGYNGWHGFVYDISTDSFTQYDYPGVSATLPLSINNKGSLVGLLSPDGGILNLIGFQCLQSSCSEITPDGYAAGIAGVTDAGAVFGTLGQQFRLAQGKYRRFTIPDEPDASLFGVNFAGTALVGASILRGQGFLYQRQTVTKLQFPGARSTFATGVNNNGIVVGSFGDSQGTDHGFIWTP